MSTEEELIFLRWSFAKMLFFFSGHLALNTLFLFKLTLSIHFLSIFYEQVLYFHKNLAQFSQRLNASYVNVKHLSRPKLVILRNWQISMFWKYQFWRKTKYLKLNNSTGFLSDFEACAFQKKLITFKKPKGHFLKNSRGIFT